MQNSCYEIADAADADSHIDDDAIDSSRLPDVDAQAEDLVNTQPVADAPADDADSAYDVPSFLRRRFHRKKDNDK